jgi:hypothetical protein
MAITDIQISEELETNAPSIKYSGNEGPKSPQEEQMMMAGPDRYFQILEFMLNELEGELGRELTNEEYEEVGRRAMDEFQQSRGPVLPEDPTKPVNPFQPKPQGPVLPDRQMAAYGGIMGLDGRRQYGIGSSLKKFVRKVIPNEVAEVAVKAAPFVAPFNPAVAAAMAGIGGFDQTGRIGSSLKNAAMTYGLGQLGRQVGGAGMQGNPFTQGGAFRGGLEGFKAGFSSPLGTSTGLGKMFADTKAPADMSKFNELGLGGSNPAGIAGNTSNISLATGDGSAMDAFYQGVAPKPSDVITKSKTGNILKTIKDFALDNKLLTGLAAGTLGATALMGNMEPEELQDMQRGEGLDVEGIRAEVIEAFKDPSGKKLAALRSKYPFLGTRDSKNISAMANGGRIGFEDGGLTEYEAYRLKNMGYDTKGGTVLEPFGGLSVLKDILRVNRANGGRMNMEEGGIMDLGGMEKDYRAEGGFVPIGREEKADDVPARLSVNEFVFTADAVRNAGGGDIDKGAEVMENMMKNLEAGGQVSEESQGIQSLRAGGRAGFANGLRVDTDKVIEDIRKFSIPGLIGKGVKAGANKISDIDLETIIKVVAKVAPGGMVMEKVTEFLVDRYGMSPDEAQMRIVNKLGTDANEGFKNTSGTSDEGYRMVGIESSAEDTSVPPLKNRLRSLLGRAPSIEMPRPEKRFPRDKFFPDGTRPFPKMEPYRPEFDDEGNPIRPYKAEPYRPKFDDEGNEIRPQVELLRDMFDTSERLSEVV